MRKSIFLLLAIMFVSVFATAQHTVGIRAGFNFATVSHNLSEELGEYADMSYESFGTLGILYKASLDENWSLSSGVSYTRRGSESKLNEDLELFDKTIPIGVKLTHRMDYIEIPVLFEYRIKDAKSVSPYIVAGANFAYELNYNMLFKSHFIVDINLYDFDVDLTNSRFNRFDLAGVIGAGVYIPLGIGNLNFDIRYLHGFTDILKNAFIDLGLKHRNIRFGVSYNYPIGRKIQVNKL